MFPGANRQVQIHHSNSLEALAGDVAARVRQYPADPIAAERVVVSHPTMQRWLTLELARANGIAANYRFELPAQFAWSMMRDVVPDLPEAQPFAPDNLRWRLFDMLPDFGELRATVQAYPVDDDAIRAQIRQDDERFGRVWCPHTATGFWVYDHLAEAQRAGRPWIVCATAHPAKFESITESVTGHPVPVPDSLQELLARPAEHVTLRAEVDALAVELDRWNAESA